MKAFYDSRKWRRARLQVLASDPECATEGCEQLATDVDHIRPIRDGGAWLDRANLQALCHACHTKKTVRETDGAGVAEVGNRAVPGSRGGGGGSNT